MTPPAEPDLVARLREEAWTAGVIGLGYVGVPLAVTAAEAGLGVVGFDIDPDRAAELAAGTSPVGDVTDDRVAACVEAGATFTADEGALADADVLFITVPSPLGRNREPDMRHIVAATGTVERVARPGQLVVLESTSYPGTTDEHVVGALERAGLVLDEDVHAAFSPERVDPGNPRPTGQIPKVVGGVTETSGRVAAAAYERFVDEVHVVSSAGAAELTKLLENTYRAVNIALVNEMAQLAHALDIDIWEVVEAAATKPFGFQRFDPGPGVGGHCIPLDPQFLAWRARELRSTTWFIDLAEHVNRGMPRWVADRAAELLNDQGRPVRDTPVLAVGLAYKRNVGDARESPALDVVAALDRRGAELGVLDPHVPDAVVRDHGLEPVAAADERDWALAVVLTDHDDLDWARIADAADAVLDTRGVYRRVGCDAANVVAL